MYDSMNGPPEPDSLQEAVCVLVHQRRSEARFFETVLVAAAASGGDTKEVFDKYRNSMFPYVERMRKREGEELAGILNSLSSRGPIVLKVGPARRSSKA